jgi:hypothetical protein
MQKIIGALWALAEQVKLEMPAEIEQAEVSAGAEPKRKFWLF